MFGVNEKQMQEMIEAAVGKRMKALEEQFNAALVTQEKAYTERLIEQDKLFSKNLKELFDSVNADYAKRDAAWNDLVALNKARMEEGAVKADQHQERMEKLLGTVADAVQAVSEKKRK